jgi:hypothetical protein
MCLLNPFQSRASVLSSLATTLPVKRMLEPEEKLNDDQLTPAE